MAFELVTNASVAGDGGGQFLSPDDVSVRFLYGNGIPGVSADIFNEPAAYALFDQPTLGIISWNEFVKRMSDVAVGDEAAWCAACGNSTGVCAPSTSSTTAQDVGGRGDRGGVWTVVAGLIGALGTLAVVFTAEAFLMFVTGLRMVRKKTLMVMRG